MLEQGWTQNRLDKCLYMLYEWEGGRRKLVGLISTHVDDVLTAGEGKVYEKAIQQLRATFPFGQWLRALD